MRASFFCRLRLKEVHHDILSHFFDSLNCGKSAGKPKNNGLLRKKNTKGLILKQKEPGWLRMEKIKRIGNDDFEKFSQVFSKYLNDDVVPLTGHKRKYARKRQLCVLSTDSQRTLVRISFHSVPSK